MVPLKVSLSSDLGRRMTNFCKILKFPNITGFNLSTERCVAKIGGYELWHSLSLSVLLQWNKPMLFGTCTCFLAAQDELNNHVLAAKRDIPIDVLYTSFRY
jgi:hypothetical protein